MPRNPERHGADESPILLLASERSGSNLLRKLIGNHPNLAGPVAPHFLAEFAPLVHLYGDLSSPENGEALFRDMRQLANHQYHGWDLHVSFGEVWERYRPICLAHMFHALYTEKARAEDKPRYCSKGIHTFHLAPEVLAAFPLARFVHLVRDPRDHVASWMRRPLNLVSPFDAVRKWAREQSQVRYLIGFSAFPLVTVRYEDLVSEIQGTMTRVLEHVGEAVDPACFSLDPERAPEAEWNPMWANLNKPVMETNFGRYHDVLDAEDIAMIEALTAPLMESYGYRFEAGPGWKPSPAYSKKVARQRTLNHVRRDAEGRASALLDSKLQMMRSIQKRLAGEQRDLGLGTGLPPVPETVAGVLRQRAKFLCYGLLGSELTRRLRRR